MAVGVAELMREKRSSGVKAEDGRLVPWKLAVARAGEAERPGGAGYGRRWWLATAIWAALKNRKGVGEDLDPEEIPRKRVAAQGWVDGWDRIPSF